MEHLSKTRRRAIAKFCKTRDMAVAAALVQDHHEHEERHKEVQTVEFRDTAEHERHHRNSAVGVAELACEQESRKHVKDACGKRGSRNNGHDPLAIGHVHESVGAP